MKKMSYSFLVGCALFFILAVFTTCSYANSPGWQNFSWGMTFEQVTEASQGRAQPADKGAIIGLRHDLELKLSMPHQQGRFMFKTFFLFDTATGGLRRVQLSPVNRQWCSDLEAELRGSRGAPSGIDRQKIITLTWPNDQGTRVSYSVLRFSGYSAGSTCWIDYEEATGAGL